MDAVVSSMLKPVREEAGLGVPPSTFTTNASECNAEEESGIQDE